VVKAEQRRTFGDKSAAKTDYAGISVDKDLCLFVSFFQIRRMLVVAACSWTGSDVFVSAGCQLPCIFLERLQHSGVAAR
jgi:hypothetical protein